MSLLPVCCFTQPDEIRVTRAWAKCEIQTGLTTLSEPALSYFRINKLGNELQLDFLYIDDNPELKAHFIAILGCLNEKYIDAFPPSVTILHSFTRNSEPQQVEAINQRIEAFKLREAKEEDVIVIRAGLSESDH